MPYSIRHYQKHYPTRTTAPTAQPAGVAASIVPAAAYAVTAPLAQPTAAPARIVPAASPAAVPRLPAAIARYSTLLVLIELLFKKEKPTTSTNRDIIILVFFIIVILKENVNDYNPANAPAP